MSAIQIMMMMIQSWRTWGTVAVGGRREFLEAVVIPSLSHGDSFDPLFSNGSLPERPTQVQLGV